MFQFTGLQIPNPFGPGGLDTFQKLFDAVITFLYYIAGPIVVGMIIFAGLKFLFAKCEPGKITEAKNILWYAIVGLVVILIGRGFIALLESIIRLGQ